MLVQSIDRRHHRVGAISSGNRGSGVRSVARHRLGTLDLFLGWSFPI